MTTEGNKKRLPPYISFRTFEAFIGRLQQQVPARIDRSYWGELLSGSNGVQLMAALRFLNLVDAYSAPTDKLKAIAAASGEHRTERLRHVTIESYSFVINDNFDIENSTYAQLEELFQNNFRLKPDVCRKCIKFFISLATSSGIHISQFVTKKVRQTYSSGTNSAVKSATNKGSTNRNGTKEIRNVQVPNYGNNNGNNQTTPAVLTELLNKFPTFDPSWSEEVQRRWFGAYDELLKRYPPAAERNSQ